MGYCVECMEHKIERSSDVKASVLRQTPIDCSSLSHKTIKTNGLTNSKLILFSVIFIITPQSITCKPLSNGWLGSPSTLSSDNFSFAMDFLVKFGYLPKSDRNSVNLRSERQLREAISAMQSFANLEPTGVIDNTTLALMRRRRCGVRDFLDSSGRRTKRYALQGSKWNKTDLTWSVKDWSAGADSHYVIKQFKRAFMVWSDVSKLTFTETRRADADILVSFLRGYHGDEYPFDGPGHILGHAFFPGDGIGGDAHFDADEQWDQRKYNLVDSDSDWEGVSLFAVAAHEFGHSLGLSHSSVAGSLMFPYYQSIGDDFKLPYDDTVGIQQLYGSKTPIKWSSFPSVSTPGYSVTNSPPTISAKTPKRASIPKISSEYPDPCNTSIDAIASIRRDIFIFKSKYFWWLKDNRTLERAQPIEVYLYWTDLPKDLDKIDAVYERQSDKKIVFFIGKQYWIFDHNNRLERGYPRSLSYIGLPNYVERVDAAMIWGHNAKTYLFSGSQYWRYEEEDNRVELDYPRDISVWKGIPFEIDSAFQWSIDSQTYFFKGHQFWKFDNRKMKVSEGYPRSIAQFWFPSLKCRNESQNKSSSDFPNTRTIDSINLSSNHILKTHIYLFSVNALLFYNFYIFNVLYNQIDIN